MFIWVKKCFTSAIECATSLFSRATSLFSRATSLFSRARSSFNRARSSLYTAKLSELKKQILAGMKGELYGAFFSAVLGGVYALFSKRSKQTTNIQKEFELVHSHGFIYVVLIAPILEEILFRKLVPDALTWIKESLAPRVVNLLPKSIKKSFDIFNQDLQESCDLFKGELKKSYKIDLDEKFKNLVGPAMPITSVIGSALLFAVAHPKYKHFGCFMSGVKYAALRNEHNDSIVPSIAAHTTNNAIAYASTRMLYS